MYLNKAIDIDSTGYHAMQYFYRHEHSLFQLGKLNFSITTTETLFGAYKQGEHSWELPCYVLIVEPIIRYQHIFEKYLTLN